MDPLELYNSKAFDGTASNLECVATVNENVPLDDYQSRLYNYKSTKGRSFLRDKSAEESTLPVLLPKGIPYAANFVSFKELQERGALATSQKDYVSISSEELHLLYQCKCIDQSLNPSWEREVRFMELLSENCKGNFFSLPENGFGVSSAEAIAYVLSSNPVYSVLELSGNHLRDEGAAHIAKLIEVNKALAHVGLGSNDIGPVGGMALADALMRNNTVVSFDLGARSGVNGNHIGTKGAEAIGKLLTCNEVLCKLNLSSNGLGASGFSCIASGLAHNHTLTYMDVSSNNLGLEGAELLASVLENGTLTHLACQRNTFGDRGGKILVNAVAASIEKGKDVVEVFNLSHNDLGEACAKSIQALLTASASLRVLNLSENRFGASVKYIMEGLLENKHLEQLNLSNCEVKGAEKGPFTAALSINATLRKLDLSHNKLGNEGTKEIGAGLVENKALLSLNLSDNKIGDGGGTALAQCLLQNSCLKELNLRRNTMSNTTGELFNEHLRSNQVLENMDTTYNDFTYKCHIGISASLERNAKLNKQHIVPKLNNEIEQLAPNEKDLAHVEEEVELEKRTIIDRSEQLLRRSEEARVVTEKLRREVVELEKVLNKVRGISDTAETEFHRIEDAFMSESSALKGKKTNMETRIQQEKDRMDRMQRDMDKMRKQIHQLQEAENKRLAPLITELEDTEADRNRQMNDAKFEAEKLSALALRKKEIEVALNPPPKKKK
ncbi:ribonuclease inhibitor-like protein [Strigomonas culicis]|uniref:Ribonuclease inhibitor-like protein n=1 Tax=Strigomonas culicis TaxID=28005 RepID=S9UWU6_9TRYP|nr:ribonuclease inhibitor-like protein [Strigomonas culicis]|eukprot:EPY33234.1 ribonuclease inhibitor-like protein [Strigomonas culicis]